MTQSRLPLTLAWAAALLAGTAAVQTLTAPGRGTGVAPWTTPSAANKSTSAIARSAHAADNETPAKIAAEPGPVRVVARGRVEPSSEQLELSIGLIGTLSRVYVAEGDAVQKGQLLAELDNGDQRARVAEAEATIQLREAELAKLLNGARPEERRQVAAENEETKANLALAMKELERRRPLAANGVASQQSLDQDTSSAAVAEAKNDAAAAALELITAPPRDEDVAIARANLALAQGNLSEQRELLEKTELRSPIDGTVLRRFLKTGETTSVQPLIPVLEVGDIHRLRVRAEIDESDVARVELGQHAWVTAPAYPNQQFGGIVSWISSRMGHKTVGSDDPTAKIDAKILEVIVDLDPSVSLPVDLRVDVFIDHARITQN